MKLDDYIRALTAGLAQWPANRARPEVGVSLIPRTPGVVSLAGKTNAGEIGLDVWLDTLPPKTPRDIRAWTFETLHAPRFSFTGADFVALIDVQKPRDAAWTRLYELVRESRDLNGEPPMGPGGIRDALLTADDGWWGLMAEQLLQEAQIECLVEDAEFVVPEALAPLFSPMEPFFDEEDHFSVYLYNLRTVTVVELVGLVEAQGRTERLGKALEQEAAEGFSDFQGQKFNDGMTWLKARTNTEAEETALSAFVCRAICRLCEEARENPVIPPELAEVFGPDERDQKRAQLRSTVSGAGLIPTLNSQPWSCYVWTATDLPVESIDQGKAVAGFRLALTAIEEFARTHESVFAEAFRLALFCLGLEPRAWDTDDEVKKLAAAFSETALDVLERNAATVRELARLEWPRDRLNAVLAAGIADVFGGMGSWNDQDFGDDYESYGRVSGGLAQSLGTLWQALLAPWRSHGLS